MRSQIKLHGARMWQIAQKQIAQKRNALPWPPRGAVLESLAIAELKPVSGPRRR